MFLDCSPVVIGIPVKQCTKCGEVKTLDQFHKGSAKFGLQSHCKQCISDYYVVNRERIGKYKRAWYEKNRGKILEYHVVYYTQNRTGILDYSRKRRAEGKDTKAAWRRANPDKVTAANNRYRARKMGNGGNYTADDLAAIRAAQTDKQGRLICWACNKPIVGKPHLDHWIPLDKGGTNDPGNLHYMHAKCNLKKSVKHPTEIGRLL